MVEWCSPLPICCCSDCCSLLTVATQRSEWMVDRAAGLLCCSVLQSDLLTQSHRLQAVASIEAKPRLRQTRTSKAKAAVGLLLVSVCC